jgi:hypothetical protein
MVARNDIFFILECDTKTLASSLKTVLREQMDIAVVGNFDVKSCYVIGNCEDKDIFALVPFAKKL